MTAIHPYAELHALSNYSFLRGASHPEELVSTAQALGYQAIAITDECSMAGVVRAHVAAKETGIQLIIGTELLLPDKLKVVLLATNRRGYSQITRLITRSRRAAPKGDYRICRTDLESGLDQCLCLLCPLIESASSIRKNALVDASRWLQHAFPQRGWLAVELFGRGNRELLDLLSDVGRQSGIPLTAAGNVHMHVRQRRHLQDALTAIRSGIPIKQAGYRLYSNGERFLRPLWALARLYPQTLLEESQHIAGLCRFSLDELRYQYPRELVPREHTPSSYLRLLTEQGMRKRWPEATPEKVVDLVDHELALIAEMRYEPYFLTVFDIVEFAKSQNILCQGRGSAANSAVCYCLGITEVDPDRMDVLFERFISKERNEPPDIDVDFEHERREEVMQYIYQKYGRERAAIAATVITYRPKSAMRDVGKALGLSQEQINRLSANLSWWDRGRIAPKRLRESGFDPENPLIKRLIYLVYQLLGFPRHLSQHVGGFVICQQPVIDLVPVENAAMADRTVIQWDKDDIDALGLLKVDCLSLGMLTAIHRSFDLIKQHSGQTIDMAGIPADDGAVYEMIQHADTIGVFQIESRAQMAMLPRLRPANFYDLVIEVAIVRPGPIQGDMVHPYLKRRQGIEAVSYPNEAVKQVLKRTLGIPIFQEQVIKLAMVAAGFSPGEADGLRRSMAAWRRRGGLEKYQEKLLSGMAQRGYDREFAEKIIQQIQGFGEYGFPESHAASFALLAYVSAWLKWHHPAAFCCALLNSLPMGFYGPSQLIQDARRHGVEVRPADITCSDWLSSLEKNAAGEAVLRLGLRVIKGLSRQGGERLVEERSRCAFSDLADVATRAELRDQDLQALAGAGALQSLAGNRHQAYWSVAGIEKALPVFRGIRFNEATPLLKVPGRIEEMLADYRSTRLTLNDHPLSYIREQLKTMRVMTSEQIRRVAHGRKAKAAGLVITRQRPGSAGNVTFVTLEDECGYINVVVWKRLAERQRRTLLGSRLMCVCGEVQREGEVIHLIAENLIDKTEALDRLVTQSRDFR